MPHMTQDQIRTLSSAELRSIVRSTNRVGSYWQEIIWARDEIARRNRFRQAVKDAVVKAGGFITAQD